MPENTQQSADTGAPLDTSSDEGLTGEDIVKGLKELSKDKKGGALGDAASAASVGAGLGAVVGSVFPVVGNAAGAAIGAGIGAALSLVGDLADAITERSDKVKELIGMANPDAADVFWDELNMLTAIGQASLDWAGTCAWGDYVTCGENTAKYFQKLVKKAAPDPWGITEAAVLTLIYKSFGNSKREKRWEGYLKDRVKKSGIQEIIAPLEGKPVVPGPPAPTTGPGWSKWFKANPDKMPEWTVEWAEQYAQALAGKANFPWAKPEPFHRGLALASGVWGLVVGMAIGHGYKPTEAEQKAYGGAIDNLAGAFGGDTAGKGEVKIDWSAWKVKGKKPKKKPKKAKKKKRAFKPGAKGAPEDSPVDLPVDESKLTPDELAKKEAEEEAAAQAETVTAIGGAAIAAKLLGVL